MRMKMLSVLGLLCALVLTASPVLAQATDDGGKIQFHGEVRLRGEFVDNFEDFDSNGINALGDDDTFDFFPYRARVGVGGEFANNVFGYVEFQTADAMGLDSEARSVLFSNSDNVDLYLANITMKSVRGSKVDLTFGRQEIKFDTEFLLGDLDFYNGVSHDGVRATWNLGSGPLDGFWVRLNESFEADADTDFWGVHNTWNNVLKDGDIGAYGYYLRADTTTGVGRTDLFVIGARAGQDVKGADGFFWNAELAGEFGNIGKVMAPDGSDASITAFGGEGWFGYNWNAGELDHRLSGRVYYATGDGDPTDDSAEAFIPLFQDFHDASNRLGVADAVYGSNVTALSIAYNLYTGPHHFGAEFFSFTTNEAAQDVDATSAVFPTRIGFDFTGAPGTFNGVAVTPNGNDENALGMEFDVLYDYQYSKNLAFNTGLGYFMPGTAVEDATGGAGDAAVRLFGQARLTW